MNTSSTYRLWILSAPAAMAAETEIGPGVNIACGAAKRTSSG